MDVEMSLTSINVTVVTPMFGGGDRPGAADPEALVRPSAVRGTLRFWWRALNAHRFDSPTDLFKAEEQLWGSADRYSPIAIRVRVSGQPSRIEYRQLIGGKPDLRYLLFPYEKAAPASYSGFGFALTLHYPRAHESDVSRTLRAWLAFGGLGARTRRGCGTLRGPDDYLPPADPVPFGEWLRELVPGRYTEPCSSTLAGSRLVVGPVTGDPISAWRELAAFWARFRRGQVGSADSGWDDHGTLAESRRSDGLMRLNKPFLGLPIIYQRLPGARFVGTLEPATSGRMSSPVILKPIALPGSGYRPGILVLYSLAPRKLKITSGSRSSLVSLEPNPQDRVLKFLRVEHPLEAVIAAATDHWGDRCHSLRIGV